MQIRPIQRDLVDDPKIAQDDPTQNPPEADLPFPAQPGSEQDHADDERDDDQHQVLGLPPVHGRIDDGSQQEPNRQNEPSPPEVPQLIKAKWHRHEQERRTQTPEQLPPQLPDAGIASVPKDVLMREPVEQMILNMV